MLHFFSGTDRNRAREALQAKTAPFIARGVVLVRVSDANAIEDLSFALEGGGMFAQESIVVLESVLEDAAMRMTLLEKLPALKASADHFFILEEKPDAATRKQIEKYAETSEKFDAPKKAESATTIFALANALRAGDKKSLWVGYQRELLKDAAPEAIHGVLFWAAKDMLLKSRSAGEGARAKKLIVQLTELPHDARRHGEDLEYALERFVLSVASR